MISLAALLMIPEFGKQVPGAVIIQGSGASDRRNRWARQISEILVSKGIAVLLTDKRGSGNSEGNWQTSNFDDLAGDVLAGAEYLRTRKEVDPERVGLVGLSQGGWIAPLVAARSEHISFVINISGASVSYAEQSFTEMANTARQAGLSDKQVSEVLELNRAAGEYLITGNWEKYAKLRDRALNSAWREIAEGFPGSPDLPIWKFLRGVAAYDPLPYWIQLTEPVLVLYGEKDEQDNVPVAESVRRLKYVFGSVGKDNYRIIVIPNAGHSFYDPNRRLMPAFVETLTSWVGEFVLPATEQSQERRPGQNDMFPQWSHDGGKIVFTSDRDGDPEIYVMNADGSNPVRLTHAPGRDAHPYFSRDGQRILFQSPRANRDDTNIYAMNSDGSNVIRLTNLKGFAGVPAYSPDEKRIVFQWRETNNFNDGKKWRICVMNADGSNLRLITPGAANDQVPNWSRDGRRLLFYSDRTGKNQIYTMKSDGTDLRQLTATESNDNAAFWSPDNKKIAFTSDRDGNNEIYVMDADGGNVRLLTETRAIERAPVWSPDGKRIAFSSDADGPSGI
jgi:TolB protein